MLLAIRVAYDDNLGAPIVDLLHGEGGVDPLIGGYRPVEGGGGELAGGEEIGDFQSELAFLQTEPEVSAGAFAVRALLQEGAAGDGTLCELEPEFAGPLGEVVDHAIEVGGNGVGRGALCNGRGGLDNGIGGLVVGQISDLVLRQDQIQSAVDPGIGGIQRIGAGLEFFAIAQTFAIGIPEGGIGEVAVALSQVGQAIAIEVDLAILGVEIEILRNDLVGDVVLGSVEVELSVCGLGDADILASRQIRVEGTSGSLELSGIVSHLVLPDVLETVTIEVFGAIRGGQIAEVLDLPFVIDAVVVGIHDIVLRIILGIIGIHGRRRGFIGLVGIDLLARNDDRHQLGGVAGVVGEGGILGEVRGDLQAGVVVVRGGLALGQAQGQRHDLSRGGQVAGGDLEGIVGLLVDDAPDGEVITGEALHGLVEDQGDRVDVLSVVGERRGGRQLRRLGVDGDGAGDHRRALGEGLVEDHVAVVDGGGELVAGVNQVGVVGGLAGDDHDEEVEEAVLVLAVDGVVGGQCHGKHLGVANLGPGGSAGEGHEGIDGGIEGAIAVHVAPQLDAGVLVGGELAEVAGDPAAHVVEADRDAGELHVGGAAVGQIQSDDGAHGALCGSEVGVLVGGGDAADATRGVGEEFPCHLHVVPFVVHGEDDGVGGAISVVSGGAELHVVGVSEGAEGLADVVGNHEVAVGVRRGIQYHLVVFGEGPGAHGGAGAGAQDDHVVERIVVAVGVAIGIQVEEEELAVGDLVALGGSRGQQCQGIVLEGDVLGADELGLRGVGVDDGVHPRQSVDQVGIEEDGLVLGPLAIAIHIIEGEVVGGGEGLVGVSLVDAVGAQSELAVHIHIGVVAGLGAGQAGQLGAQGDGCAVKSIHGSAHGAVDQHILVEEALRIEGDDDGAGTAAQSVGGGLGEVGEDHAVAVPAEGVGAVETAGQGHLLVAVDRGARGLDQQSAGDRGGFHAHHVGEVGIDGGGEDVGLHAAGDAGCAGAVGDVIDVHGGVEADAEGQLVAHAGNQEEIGVLVRLGGDRAGLVCEQELVVSGAGCLVVGDLDGALHRGIRGGIELSVAVGIAIEDQSALGGFARLQGGQCGLGIEALHVHQVNADAGDVGLATGGGHHEVVDVDEGHQLAGIHGLARNGLLGEESVGDGGALDLLADDLSEAVDLSTSQMVIDALELGAEVHVVVDALVRRVVVHGFGGIQEAGAHLELVAERHILGGLHADEEVLLLRELAVHGGVEPRGDEIGIGHEGAGPGVAAAHEDGGLHEGHEHVGGREGTGAIHVPPQGDAAVLIGSQGVEVAGRDARDAVEGDIHPVEAVLVHEDPVGRRAIGQAGAIAADNQEGTAVVGGEAIAVDDGELADGGQLHGAAVAEADGAVVVGDGVPPLLQHVAHRHDLHAGDIPQRGGGTAIGVVDGKSLGGGAAQDGGLHHDVVGLAAGDALQDVGAGLAGVHCIAAIPGELVAIAGQRSVAHGSVDAHGEDAHAGDGGGLLDLAGSVIADGQSDRLIGSGKLHDGTVCLAVAVEVDHIRQSADHHEGGAVGIRHHSALVGRIGERHGGAVVQSQGLVSGLVDQSVRAGGEVLGDGLHQDGSIQDVAGTEAAGGVLHIHGQHGDGLLAGSGDAAGRDVGGDCGGGGAELCAAGTEFLDGPRQREGVRVAEDGDVDALVIDAQGAAHVIPHVVAGLVGDVVLQVVAAAGGGGADDFAILSEETLVGIGLGIQGAILLGVVDVTGVDAIRRESVLAGASRLHVHRRSTVIIGEEGRVVGL